MKFHIVYFISILGLWIEKTEKSYQNILKSGILDNTDLQKLYVVFTGDVKCYDKLKSIWCHKKIEIEHYSENVKLHEYPGIKKIKDISNDNTNDYVFYFHAKGITRENQANDWVAYLEYFNIIRYQECIKHLKENDVVGVEYLEIPSKKVPPHMSGNFWWAKCSYINKLTLPEPDATRHDFEWFIGNCKTFKIYSLHQSRIDTPHFKGFNGSRRNRYKIWFYQDKPIIGYKYYKNNKS